MTYPLSGYRVLDLTNVLAGPFCTHQLAHLGAEVIKIEHPERGDLARQLGADPDLNAQHMGVSFLAQNSGKQSVTLNLKHSDGVAVFHDLLATADVVVENFRPGVMDRLGIGPDALRARHPELIYCAISGFGQDGPLSEAPAYDQIVQGMSGVMSITGDSDSAPLRVGYPVADTLGGMTAAFAVAAALAKPSPGRGTVIDVSMLDSVLSAMGWVVSNHLMADQTPRPMGNDNFTASPSGVFQTQDGPINIAANTQKQFETLCEVVGLPEIKTDHRFRHRQARLENRAILTGILEDALAAQRVAFWVEKMTAAGVPAGAVQSVPEALQHPQITERDLIGMFHVDGIDRDVRLARPGLRIDDARPATSSPPPELGADTDMVLTSLGYSVEKIQALRRSGAI